jgi:hypothetical protein
MIRLSKKQTAGNLQTPGRRRKPMNTRKNQTLSAKPADCWNDNE